MILQKRNSLEKFIREQLIGPGGCNYQFSVHHNGDEQELAPSLSYGEVLNTTPGSIYSSAILFPEKAIEDTASNPITPAAEENVDDDISIEYSKEWIIEDNKVIISVVKLI